MDRYGQFWQVSKYIKDIPNQTVLESPLKNATGSGIVFPNNYSTGDMYGDIFATKSVLDAQYDMELGYDNVRGVLKSSGREYIGMGNCSNQLFMLFNPTAIDISQDGKTTSYREHSDALQLEYQMVEVVKNINRFESSIKHKPNVFSVVV